MAQTSTGYGPRRTLIFDGDETKYELWEVKFLGYLRLQKLFDVAIKKEGETDAPSADKNANVFAELVQCLDDRSLSLVIREANNDGRKAIEVLREHYQGKGKPRIIALYTELTSLKMKNDETSTDYILRAEKAATSLKTTGEVISDGLLVSMALKGLPEGFKTFTTVVSQRDPQMTFSEFKTALRNFEETEKSCKKTNERNVEENIMTVKSKFNGKCFNCGRNGHKSADCRSKEKLKWCTKCQNATHNTQDCRKNKSGDTAKKTEDNHEFMFTVDDQSPDEVGKDTMNLLVDSGATSHIIKDRNRFIDFEDNFNAKNHQIELADGSKANVVKGRGKARVKLYDTNGSLHEVVLNNALYIPSYNQNIFSVSAAISRGGSVSLENDNRFFKAPNGTKFEIEQKGRLYYLNSISSSKISGASLMEWHKILGHCNFHDLRKLRNVVEGMKITDEKQSECSVCTCGKMCQTRSKAPDERSKTPLEFVHCDLAGPITPAAKGGFRYALCFVDDFTGIHMVYFLKQKSDTVEATRKFLADSAPYGKVKRLRSDNGGEFINKDFKALMRANVIKHEMCAPYSPHQNGTVERAWRTLFEMARCLLLESKLPKFLWTYAVMTAAYIRNRCFNARLGKTPFEVLVGRKPDISNMHVFGSTCYSYVQNAKKLDPRSKEGVFVGYDRDTPAYLVYFPTTQKVERVRCVKFHELSGGDTDYDEDNFTLPKTEKSENETRVDVETEQNKTENVQEKRYPTRTRNKPKYLDDYVLDNSDDCANYNVDYCYRTADIPSTYGDALRSHEADKWRDAMNDEMTALSENDTFDLVPPPEGRQVVGGRWVYAVKTNPNGDERHKARYVAKGYSQVANIDYQETFAPTARMSSVRMLMQLAVQNDMITHQMDVKTAYLNAPIDREIYIEQPQGFQQQGKNGERLVCKLKKSLYGLKQSGRNWNSMLHNYLLSQNFAQSLADPCVYSQTRDKGKIILIIWVDDIIISATDSALLESIKSALSSQFKMKDLGSLTWFLGTEFKCEGQSIKMSQTLYIDKVLSKFEMADCKPKPTPCAIGTAQPIEETTDSLSDPRLYRAIVGSLIYVMTGTRPDLCYAVTKLSQKMANPTHTDIIKAKHVLRYLKGTKEHGLRFQKSETPLKLTGFCDSDWGASVEDRHSITGYNFQLTSNGPLISWKSRKQQTVALSTCEAEYISLANACQEAKFLKQLCNDMGIGCQNVLINVDNQGAINLAKNPVNHQRSKHIDIKYHFIRAEIQKGTITVQYVPTDNNVSDIFTKPATKFKLEKFRPFIMGD